jgi:hypothetical protein
MIWQLSGSHGKKKKKKKVEKKARANWKRKHLSVCWLVCGGHIPIDNACSAAVRRKHLKKNSAIVLSHDAAVPRLSFKTLKRTWATKPKKKKTNQ